MTTFINRAVQRLAASSQESDCSMLQCNDVSGLGFDFLILHERNPNMILALTAFSGLNRNWGNIGTCKGTYYVGVCRDYRGEWKRKQNYYLGSRDMTPQIANQMEKTMENDMEILGSFKGVLYVGLHLVPQYWRIAWKSKSTVKWKPGVYRVL